MRAQEALGVLLAADGPIDAAEEPAFAIPQEPPADAEWMGRRTDLRLFGLREEAAQRVVRDSRRDWLPSVSGVFQPQYLTPSNIFQPSRSWRALLLFDVPIFDAGLRRGVARERESQRDAVRAGRLGALQEARAEVRVAREAVASADRALASAQAAAGQAEEVVSITDISYRAGATSNIEVIDAQRRARDAQTTVAIAEDSARRARLELMIALGRFP
ncbi:MAG: TolC family protein [Acidobacteria bacterium]|nr:TolC family protein [Acidobacteriota bacterium]